MIIITLNKGHEPIKQLIIGTRIILAGANVYQLVIKTDHKMASSLGSTRGYKKENKTLKKKHIFQEKNQKQTTESNCLKKYHNNL